MSILPEAAVRWAESRSAAGQLRKAVRERLLAAEAPPVGDGRLDEFPEDVVTALLEHDDLAGEERLQVAGGWDDARREVERLLTDPDVNPADRKSLQAPFLRVYRVAELSGDPMLSRGVRAALPQVIGNPDSHPELTQQVVQAAMRYLDKDDRPTWKRFLEYEDIAGLAFLALLEIDPHADDISTIFFRLMERQFCEEWGIDVWFLGEYVRTYAGDMKPVRNAIKRFAEENPERWREVAEAEKDNPCWPKDVLAPAKSYFQTISTYLDAGTPNMIVDDSALLPSFKYFEYRLPQAVITRSFVRIALEAPSFETYISPVSIHQVDINRFPAESIDSRLTKEICLQLDEMKIEGPFRENPDRSSTLNGLEFVEKEARVA